jgi:hypothetical protein
MKYYTYDGIVYREPEPGAHFERWNGEEWIAAAAPRSLRAKRNIIYVCARSRGPRPSS